MKKGLMIALVVVMIVAPLLLACSSANSWRIVSKIDADEYPVYQLRSPSGAVMTGVPAGGSKKVPPVGTVCKLTNNGTQFDCGSKYQRLNAFNPTPV